MSELIDASDVDVASADDPVLAQWVADAGARLELGEPIDLEAYRVQDAKRAERLSKLLPTLVRLARLGTTASGSDDWANISLSSPSPIGRSLGDFRPVRELGRGGMGIVYEAVQISLNRRVALKILPMAAAMDSLQVRRFQVEAQAAALLQHVHIVPVYSVGCEHGVPYYAMQYIEGRSLSELIRELTEDARRDLHRPAGPPGHTFSTDPASGRTTAAEELPCSAEVMPELDGPGAPNENPQVCPAHTEAPFISSDSAVRTRDHVRTVAALGLQAAEALGYAHEQGVVHRDIKPANLLLDTRGNLWVTDFGLAHVQTNPSMTAAGAMVGTLRYMSPEQASGIRGLTDHRTDVYSLGVTLYELLTLRPAVSGHDGREIVRQITEREPPPIRGLNPAVPIDLGTIVTKAMAKEPSDRYSSAQELAEDLKLFLNDRPIHAQPLTPAQKVARWMRKNPRPLVASITLALLVALGLVAAKSWSSSMFRAHNTRLEVEIERTARHAREAEERRRVAVRHVFAANLSLASQALNASHAERAQEILRDAMRGTELQGFVWDYLWRTSRREVIVLLVHESKIANASLGARGRFFVVTDPTGVIHWDLLSDPPNRRHWFPGEYYRSPAISSDGQLVAFVDGRSGREIDLPIVVWDTTSDRELARIDGDPSRIMYQHGFVGSSHVLAVNSMVSPKHLQDLRLWDLDAGTRPKLILHLRDLRGVTFASDKRFILVAIEDQLFVYDYYKQSPIGSVQGKLDGSWPWAVSSDGCIVSASVPGRGVVRWNAQSGVEIGRDDVGGKITSLVISPDNSTLAIVTDAQLVYVRGKGNDRLLELRPDHVVEARGARVLFSPDGLRVATSADTNHGGQLPAAVWDVATGRRIATFPGRVLGASGDLTFTPDGRSLVLNGGQAVCQWRLDPDDPPSPAGHSDEAWTVAFSPDSRIVASGSNDSTEEATIKLWSTADARLTKSWHGHPATVTALAFSPDGRTLASAGLSETQNVRLWAVETGELLATLEGHMAGVRAIAFSPDGATLASAGSDKTIRLWDVAARTARRTLKGHTDKVRAVAFARDGTLASAGNDATIRFWDVLTGDQTALLRISEQAATVGFSPDGRTFAAADESGHLILWDRTTASSTRTISAESEELRCLAFSPDGMYVASAGSSPTIRIWDIETKQEVLSLRGHSQKVNSLAFSPDGRVLASCSHDGVLKLWRAGKP